MLLVGKAINEQKEKFAKEQNYCCKLCGLPFEGDVSKQHLDHDHALEGKNAGKVRSLLCPLCNAAEGQMKHKFNRSGLKGRDIDYVVWLEALVGYLKQDYSENNLHPNYPTDMAKQFSRLSKPDMIESMQSYGFSYNTSDSKEQLLKSFKKQFKKAIK